MVYTIKKRHVFEEEIKKSRFIATGIPIASVDDVAGAIEASCDPQANHNCFAYKVADAYRFSDDGEPGGTAGRPILSAIEGRDLSGVLVVVTRFFGGIKLGAGGLVRAYGGAAAKCLNEATLVEVVAKASVEIAVPFEMTGALHQVLDEFGVNKTSETFSESGVALGVELEQAALETFTVALADATRGRAVLTVNE